MDALAQSLRELPRVGPSAAFAADVRLRLEARRPAVGVAWIEAMAACVVVGAVGWLAHRLGLMAMLQFGLDSVASHLPASIPSLDLPKLPQQAARWLALSLCFGTMVLHGMVNQMGSEVRR